MEDDPVIYELPIYLNTEMSDQLALLQYPLRPAFREAIAEPKSGRVKPENKMLQLDIPLQNNTQHFDEDAEEYLKQKNITLQSSRIPPITTYAIGIHRDGQIHLNPVGNIYQMRPSFSHIDEAIDAMKVDDDDFIDDSMDTKKNAEIENQPLQVQMKKKESEKASKARKSSYAFKKQQENAEAWKELVFENKESEISEEVLERLFCETDQEITFEMTPKEYLESLRYPNENNVEKSINNSYSNAGYKEVENLFKTYKILSLETIRSKVDCLSKETLMEYIKEVSYFVNGVFVVKGHVLDVEPMASVRDGLLYMLSKNSVKRMEACDILKISPQKCKELLEDYSLIDNHTRSWSLKVVKDEHCDKSYLAFFNDQKQQWNERIDHLRQLFTGIIH